MKTHITISLLKFKILVLFLIGPLWALSQKADDNAFAGKKHVFLYHGFEPASLANPDSEGNTGFILQRHDRDQPVWIEVLRIHSPQNAGELLNNYMEALKIFPNNKARFDAAASWSKFKNYRTYDSVATELLSPAVQMAFGILIADSTVKAGKTYQYRLLRDKEPVTAAEQRLSNWVSYPARLEMPRPVFSKRRTERDAIILEWKVKEAGAPRNFEVYRAKGNERIFEKIIAGTFTIIRNDSLYYTLQDVQVLANEMYRYYITPLNNFGGGGNISSDTISATTMNPKQLQAAQYINTTEDLKQRAIILHYALPQSDFIGSIHIMRSESYDKDFEEVGVSAPLDSIFTDKRIVPGRKYYYYVQMTDKMGRNAARSIKTFGLFQEEGNLFPARFVKAESSREGIKISWNNPPDTSVISGYYVCRAMGKSGSFHRITTLILKKDPSNTYLDTSSVLQPGMLYAYSVLSENLSNKVSKNSVIAYATASGSRSAIKLITPKSLEVVSESNAIRLFWYDMRLVNRSQVFYNIYRRSGGQENFTAIASDYPASLTSYRDTTTEKGFSYEYAVEAEDNEGNKSELATIQTPGIMSLPLYAPAISVFVNGDGALVSWEPVADKRIGSYTVYKYSKGEEPIKIAELRSDEKQFEDKKLASGNTYYYFLSPVGKKGAFTSVESNHAYLVK